MTSLGTVDLAATSAPIAVLGPDAAKLLQSLVCHDVRRVTVQSSSLGALTNPHGRVLVLLRQLAVDSGCVLLVPDRLVDGTIAHLQRYRFRAQVQIEDWRATHAAVGVMGAEARGWIAARFEVAPDPVDSTCTQGELRIVRLHGQSPRYLVFGPRPALAERLGELQPVESGETMWRLAQIEAGEPALAPELTESFLPQNLNLEALGGLSFNKGCYTGQEVIARTQHLGTIKRRLVRAVFAGDPQPAPGAALLAVTSNAASEGGRVLSAASHRLLAVVPVAGLEPGCSFYLDETPRRELSALELL